MALALPPPVAARFVKASTGSITLDFVLPPAGPPVEKYELQFRAAAEQEWASASASLKSKRCTKGNLASGTAYVFRVRASAGGERWGPFGEPTEKLYTTLPELPDDVSESLKVPSKVIASAAEAAAKKALENAKALEAQQAMIARQEEEARKAADVLDKLRKQVEERCRVIVGASLTQVAQQAERRLELGVVKVEEGVREKVEAHLRDEEAKAVGRVLKNIKVTEVLTGPSTAMVAQMQREKDLVRVTGAEHFAVLLAAEVDKLLMSLEAELDAELLQGLREGRERAEEVLTEVGQTIGDATVQRHTMEAALLDAVQTARLSFSASAEQAVKQSPSEPLDLETMISNEKQIYEERCADVLEGAMRSLHGAIARSLQQTETRMLRRQQAAVVEAWLLAEALRSRNEKCLERDTLLKQGQKLLETRRQLLNDLQRLLNDEQISTEARSGMVAGADMAKRLADKAMMDAEDVSRQIAAATSPWMELQELGNEKCPTPKELLPDVLMLTGDLTGEAMQAAVDRAVSSVRPLQVERLDASERLDLSRKAMETVLIEAVHWSKLRQQLSARTKLTPADIPDEAQRALRKNAAPAPAACVTSAEAEPRHPAVEVNIEDVLSKLIRRVYTTAKSLSSGADEEEAMRELVTATVKEVESSAAIAQEQAIEGARRDWERMREAERRMEFERSRQEVQKAIANAMEGQQHMIQQTIDDAVRNAEEKLKAIHATAMCDAIQRTMVDTKAACEIDMQEQVKVAFERGKTATRLQADRATLNKAREEAMEEARKKFMAELLEAREAVASATKEAAQLRDQLEALRASSAQEIAQAIAKAVPKQRAAAEAYVSEQLKMEKARLLESHKIELEVKLAQERSRAEQQLRAAVAEATQKTKEAAIAQAQQGLKAAVDEARRDEALKQQEVMRRELRAAHTQFTERAKVDTQRAVAEALSLHMKKQSKVLESKAMSSLLDKTGAERRAIEAAAAEQIQLAIAKAEKRHQKQQAEAVAKAVQESNDKRKEAEEKTAQQRVQAALELAKRRAESELQEALREQELELKKKANDELVEALQAAKSLARKETMELIKPQLQKQEAVEEAIRAAEERARDRERSLAAQIQARIEERASDMATQPAAVQAAVRAAVRECEERAEARLAAVHSMYEKAAAEQQIQIKELLRMTQVQAKEHHETLLAAAIREVKEKAETEKQLALEQAREVVKISAVQQAEQMDSLLAELAEVRAENLRLTSEMEARTRDLAEIASMSAMYNMTEGDESKSEFIAPTEIISPGEKEDTPQPVYSNLLRGHFEMDDDDWDGKGVRTSDRHHDESVSVVASTILTEAYELDDDGPETKSTVATSVFTQHELD